MIRGKQKTRIVNYKKLMYIPLTIALLAVITITCMTSTISRYLLIKQMREDGMIFANEYVLRIEENKYSISIINQMLDEKLKIVSHIVLDNKENISDELLQEIQKKVGIDEVNWISNTGKILYSNVPENKGWVAYKGHPLYDFIRTDENELIEDIRHDAITVKLFKYGAIKSDDGFLVQVGILASNIYALTEKYSYQSLVDRLSHENNIVYSQVVDNNFRIVADGCKGNIGKKIDGEDRGLINKGLNGNPSSVERYYEKVGEKLLNVAVPITEKGQVSHVLLIGISMKEVYSSIYLNTIVSSIIGLIMFLIFAWVQNINIIKPAKELDKYINEINIESNIFYKINVDKNHTFEGLIASINKILNKAYTYFQELRENQEKLNSANVELQVANEQLKDSEESLKIQYNEIQDYTEKLEDLKKRYEISFKGTNSAVWEFTLADKKLYISDELRDILGRSFINDDYIVRVLNSMLTVEDIKVLINEYKQFIEKERTDISTQVSIEDKNGKKRHLLIRGKRILDKDNVLKSINGILYDITKLKEQEAEIRNMAYHDSLTGLPNRRNFMEKLEYELSMGNKGVVILIDIDNFKGINDTLGHAYGDKVLLEVSKTLNNISCEKNIVCRFGGDEFLILFKEENLERIKFYVEKIRKEFKKDLIIENHSVHLNFSMGITKYPDDSSDVNQLIMNADTAMYIVKTLGKNNYMFFTKEMTERLKEKVEIENILRNAIKEESFTLMYQPQVSVKNGQVIGFEALLRLKDYNISPRDFIPIAEETGMIVDIGRLVTRKVLEQMDAWRKKGLELKLISVNFSSKQFNDKTYHMFLRENLEKYHIDPKYIEIEITESILLEETEETINYLMKFKEMGLSIALDDFGTGYSSINYLTYIPIDKVKLDKSLNDKFLRIENIKVIDSIISLVHSLGLEITAEGIEEIEQYKKLKVGGCDYIQGYFFSKPVLAEEVEKIYNHNFLENI